MKILIHCINFHPELTGIGKYTGEMSEWFAARGHEVRVVAAPPYYPEWKVGEGYSNWWARENSGSRGKEQVVRCKGQGARSKVQGERGRAKDARGKGQGARGKEQGVRGEASNTTLESCSLNLFPVLVYRCPLWVPSKPSGLKRIVHLASFALSSFPEMLRQIFWKPDIVFVVEPPLFCSPSALIVARLTGAKSWLHVQDFEVDAAFDLGILPKGRIRNMVLGMESWLMQRFDRVSTISGKMLEKLGEKQVEESRRAFFPNWVDVGSIFPLESSPMRSELGIPDRTCICLYSGNMGEKQGLEILVQAARIISEERGEEYRVRGEEIGVRGEEQGVRSEEKGDVVFVICGNGGARDRLVQSAQGLKNIIWLPLQPVERLNELLNMADIHLLPQRADVADLVMPSKLTGMLASGKPVIATARADTEVGRVVSECGAVVEPGDAEALAREILSLAANSGRRKEMGEAGRKYAIENLGIDSILSRIESIMRSVVRES